MRPLKVFAFDYACAGGPAAPRLEASQRQDGALMLRALCADLRLLPDVELLAFQNASPQPAGAPFGRRFAERVLAADAVWPLAPIAGGILERVSRQVLRHGRILLGSAPDAVRVAASKQLTCAALQRAGVPTVSTFAPQDLLPDGSGAWVVKPDDGAACIDTRLFPDRAAAQGWASAQSGRKLVLQPFVAGRIGSLSLLCHDGGARVVGCNEQRIAVHDNQFRFLGCTVNGLAGMVPDVHELAQRVAAALPGLWGYVGVDFILAAGGVLVLDVNPRLTLSYAGLRASTGVNPAALVMALLDEGAPPYGDGRAPFVSVDVAAFGPR
ncbi:putative ATP-grasp superfamily ATP-dependent carboligase [Pseudoduganella flava]|uniref:ATP-grasp domain-containing protein n=1 Tax=Pseudoduganella flava TaxID=871742 RepID=A0A562PIW1_9BURK|nr:ATP-grasp domain-containing protein [Pseudoduganella flava]QGZ41990.1 ATP-grasp domain-containing protein [Pseudoduganella flava]TWI44402.1 putative ATP-grasp superfamily ATP-dependent carboligase [Pseudoduganella flava]